MTVCVRCEKPMVALDADRPTNYQFDNALWIGFHGGYGMFVDNLEANLPTNTEEQWVRNSDARDEYGYCDYFMPEGKLVDNLDYVPTYNEERILPGRPDYEAVLCHECAHTLCEWHPWLAKLLNPHGSHAHRRQYHLEHPNHRGWDYER